MSDPGLPPKQPISVEETIAILISFSAIGTIFFFSFSRTEQDSNLILNLRASTSLPATDGANNTPSSATPAPTTAPPFSGPVAPFPGTGSTPAPGSLPPGATQEKGSFTLFAQLFFSFTNRQPAATSPTTSPATPSPSQTTTPPPNPTVPTLPTSSLPDETAATPTPTAATPTPTPTAATPKPTSSPIAAAPSNVPPVDLPIQEPPPEQVKEKPPEFSDVPKDSREYKILIIIATRGIISGYEDGTFRPENPVTRAEFASMLEKTFDAKKVAESLKFGDIPADYWAVGAIDEATQTGFLKGYPQQIFQPTQKIPRVQVLVSLASGLGLTPKSDPEKTLQTAYGDAKDIPQWARAKVAAATEIGLVFDNNGTGKTLNPNVEASRGDIALLMYQALEIAGAVEKIPRQ